MDRRAARNRHRRTTRTPHAPPRKAAPQPNYLTGSKEGDDKLGTFLAWCIVAFAVVGVIAMVVWVK